MSMTNKVKQALVNRQVTFGSWLQIGACPGVAEILANAGYDWLVVDCEHSAIDVEGFTALARGMHGRGPLPLARVRENDTLAIRQMLDAGAQGIIVPLVNNADEARRAVAAAKYPPQGIRGFCFSRMNDYGVNFDEYAAAANDNIALIVMIESRQAVEEIDKILNVSGVDGVLIGPYDLSGSYELTGQTNHPTIRAAREKVAAACQRHGKSAGLHLVHPTRESIQDTIDHGFTFIALGVDMVFLNEASRSALNLAREISAGN
jgi:2-keto-3-deoxy-L-rhamnonate aldolase RhmA